jgi:methylthioxylose transferase
MAHRGGVARGDESGPASEPYPKRARCGEAEGPLRVGLVALVLLATFAASRLDPSSASHGGTARPLNAAFNPSIGWGLLPPVAVGTGLCFALPALRAAKTWSFLAWSVVLGWAFSVTLAMHSQGTAAITHPFTGPGTYWSELALVERFGLRGFDARYPHLFTDALLVPHAAVHPQGSVLFLLGLSRLTGRNVLGVCLLIALVGCLGAVPTYFLAREWFGEGAARWAALLFVASPGILLYSSASMDVVFVTVIAVALAALVRAWRSDAWAVGAGCLAAVAICFTFGALALAPVAIGVAVTEARRMGRLALRRGLLVLAGALSIGLLAWIALDIDLLATFRSSLQSQERAADQIARPYRYWVWANVAALFISAGIGQTSAFVARFAERWRRRKPGLETVVLGSILLASVTGLFRGETDRIWLFFVPLLCALGGSAVRDGEERVSVTFGLIQATAMQTLLFIPWR